MKLIGAFFRLVRWPNLIFIALTQFLFYYCFMYSRDREGTFLRPSLFILLVAASVLIAAGGYIINDYFDLNIDKINKPSRLVVDKIIHRRWAILWHLFLTVPGVVISFYIGYKLNNWFLGPINLMSAGLLWVYSTTFKRELMIGNIIISVLTAWVVLVLYVCEFHYVINGESDRYKRYITQLFKVAVLYGGFAFIISLIREVVKDLEDMQGDEKYGCRTMPIVWGVPVSKIFIATWLVVLIAALAIVQIYVLTLHLWWWSAIYCLLFIIIPLLYILRNLYGAMVSEDYHKLSSRIKFVMLTGILSMIFLKFTIRAVSYQLSAFGNQQSAISNQLSAISNQKAFKIDSRWIIFRYIKTSSFTLPPPRYSLRSTLGYSENTVFFSNAKKCVENAKTTVPHAVISGYKS